MEHSDLDTRMAGDLVERQAGSTQGPDPWDFVLSGEFGYYPILGKLLQVFTQGNIMMIAQNCRTKVLRFRRESKQTILCSSILCIL